MVWESLSSPTPRRESAADLKVGFDNPLGCRHFPDQASTNGWSPFADRPDSAPAPLMMFVFLRCSRGLDKALQRPRGSTMSRACCPFATGGLRPSLRSGVCPFRYISWGNGLPFRKIFW